jgi:type IV secretion system protein VirB10
MYSSYQAQHPAETTAASHVTLPPPPNEQADEGPPKDLTAIPPDRLPTATPVGVTAASIGTRDQNGYLLAPGQTTPQFTVTPPPTLPPDTPNLAQQQTYPDQLRTAGYGAPVTSTTATDLPPSRATYAAASDPDAAARAAAAEQHRALIESASNADIIVRPAVANGPLTSGSTNDGSSAAYGGAPSMPPVRSAADTVVGSASGVPATPATQSRDAQLERLNFLSNAENDAPLKYLGSVQTSPISPYEVVAGSVIPATLIGGINTDVPSEVIAEVRKDVYDTRSGGICLIPKGTKLIAEPDTKLVADQRRVLVAFTRLIFPDTSNVDLKGMPGSDLSGYGGVTGATNTHINRVLAQSFLEAVLAGAVTFGGSAGSNGGTSVSVGGSNSTGAASQVAQDTMSSLRGTVPTIEVRPGFRFNVVVNRDIVFTAPWSGKCGG